MMERRAVIDHVDPTPRADAPEDLAVVLHVEHRRTALGARGEQEARSRVERDTARSLTAILPGRGDLPRRDIDRDGRAVPCASGALATMPAAGSTTCTFCVVRSTASSQRPVSSTEVTP